MKIVLAVLLMGMGVGAFADQSVTVRKLRPLSDRIVAYMAEIKDGKETDNAVLIDMIIDSENEEPQWRMTQTWFQWDYQSGYLVTTEQSTSIDNYSVMKLVKNMEWQPQKSFKCKMDGLYYGEVTLIGERVIDSKGNPIWQLSGEGFTKESDYAKLVPYKLVQIPELHLKGNVLHKINVTQ
jgi:hypothetical protein